MLAALEQFMSPLATVVEADEVSLRGEWSTSTTLTYAHPSQAGTGEGPFVELHKALWRGVAQGPRPLAGLAFSVTTEGVSWARSERPAASPALEISVWGYKSGTTYEPGTAWLGFNFHGTILPGQRVPSRDGLIEVSPVREGPLITGRLGWVGEAQGVNFGLVLLPGPALKIARNGLWHLRDRLAVALPEPLRRLLTRGRSGFLPASALTHYGP
jgi:hypothetical protein